MPKSEMPESHIAPMLDRAKALATRLGIDPEQELLPLRLGPHHGWLHLIPLMERLMERIEALEKRS